MITFEEEPETPIDYNSTVNIFDIFPAPSGRAKCKVCKKTINKMEMKLSYTEPSMFGGQVRNSDKSVCKTCAKEIFKMALEKLDEVPEPEDNSVKIIS